MNLLTARALVLLPLIAVAVRAGGMRRVARRQLTHAGAVRVDEARAAAIARAVHRAARVARPSCLTRALTIGRLLTHEGLEARLTIGVSRAPFEAHAWLEHGTRVLAGDAPARGYAPLWRIEAGRAPVFTSAP